MVNKQSRSEIRVKKHNRMRNRFAGTAERPRLAVFRSNNHMYAQIIDDTVGNTLVAASTLQKDVKAELEKTNNVEAAACLGKVIAEKAKEFITEDAVVFIDAGTTTYELAMQLEHMTNLVIVTNDIKIAARLSETHDNIIVCGGQIQKTTGCIMGYYASKMMESFTFDIGFFGTASIDDNFNVACPTIEKAFLKKQLVSQCVKSYLLVDAGKFHKNGMNRINSLSDYSAVVTDYEFTPEERERLARLNVHTLLTK